MRDSTYEGLLKLAPYPFAILMFWLNVYVSFRDLAEEDDEEPPVDSDGRRSVDRS